MVTFHFGLGMRFVLIADPGTVARLHRAAKPCDFKPAKLSLSEACHGCDGRIDSHVARWDFRARLARTLDGGVLTGHALIDASISV